MFITNTWQPIGCGCSSPPGTPGAISGISIQTPAANGQVYSVQPVSGAPSYAWTVPAGWTITLGQGTSSITVTTGNSGDNGNILVHVVNPCGNSSDQTLMVSVQPECNAITVNHTVANGVAPVNKSVTYTVVLTAIGGTGDKCWIAQNLGAASQPSSASDNTEAAAGWYWQFNRKQGYKHDGSVTPAWSITSISESSEWIASNDPCLIELGSGWRLPTETEWTNADGAPQNWNTHSDVFNSVLKLHAGGYLYSGGGILYNRGSSGLYWSSKHSTSTFAIALNFYNPQPVVDQEFKADAYTIRCLRD
ncbi:MAG: hypothetical protein IT223_07570 [Crocinitomicaceae bacterium]|nr:hypothetical protein [Crocinitomicaceae bacterium]